MKFGGWNQRQQPAVFHQSYPVGEDERFTYIMRHKEHRLSKMFLQRAKFSLDLGTRNRIESTERLIQQKNRRISGKCAGNTDALALAS